jgi:hypothetical protein
MYALEDYTVPRHIMFAHGGTVHERRAGG